MTTPARRVLTAIVFAVVWTAGMVLWSGDHTVGGIVTWAVFGVLAGAALVWLMARTERRRAAGPK